MKQEKLNYEQMQIITEAITNASDRAKLIEYLDRNDIVGGEVFPYLVNTKTSIDADFMYSPIKYDLFIKRMPFYFYQPDREMRNVGNLSQYIMGQYKSAQEEEDFPQKLEELFTVLERMYYHHKVDLKTIFNYPIEQTGYCSRVDVLMQWGNYLDLAERYNISDQTPEHFIVDYNYILETAGIKPIIYEIENSNYDGCINRNGKIITVNGIFPCDKDGNPIMRWIGLKVINSEKIWAKVDKRLKGSLFIETNSRTAIFGLNCWGINDDGTDCWYRLYAGPLLLEFDYEKLKESRKREKLTQKQVAEAIGAAERTYQKWESGETTPDCIYLLRLMNVLDIKEVAELTRINI